MAKLIFEQLIENLGNVKDRPLGDPWRRVGEDVTITFDRIVTSFMGSFPHPKITELMSLFFNLVGNKITPAAVIGAKGTSIYFYFEIQPGLRAAAVVVPANWLELVRENPRFQCGAMIYTASKAQDYYNDQLGRDLMQQRGMAYEAEYLKVVQTEAPSYQMNEYQQKVLAAFPEGLSSLEGRYIYVRKPWNPNTPQSMLQ